MTYSWLFENSISDCGDWLGRASAATNVRGGEEMGKGQKGGGAKSTPMTKEAASRIQRSADRTSRNQDFKGRAQRAASKNEGD